MSGGVETMGLLRGASVRTMMSGRGDDIPEFVETASLKSTQTYMQIPDIPENALSAGVHPVTRNLLKRSFLVRKALRVRTANSKANVLTTEERAMVRFAGTHAAALHTQLHGDGMHVV